MKTLASIVSSGALTPLGLNSVQTAFLYRAGMAAMASTALIDAADEPFTFCVQPTLDPRLVGGARAVKLAEPALLECITPVLAVGGAPRIKTLLAVDSYLAKATAHNVEAEAAELIRRVGALLAEQAPGSKLKVCARDAAGPTQLLPEALQELANREIDVLIFGGVHTDYDPKLLAELDAKDRIFKPKNLDSFIPGEAAVFVAMMRSDLARQVQLPELGKLHAVASGYETATPDNDESAFVAKGLTTVIRAVTADLVAEQLRAGWAIGDLTFEMRRIYEWQSMVVRTRKVWGEPHHIDYPAQRIGYLGAAGLPFAMMLASEGFRRGFAPSPYCVAFAGNDSGERAALLMSAGESTAR